MKPNSVRFKLCIPRHRCSCQLITRRFPLNLNACVMKLAKNQTKLWTSDLDMTFDRLFRTIRKQKVET
jgi:hypothetical protein